MEIRDQFHDPAGSYLFHLLSSRPSATEFVKHADVDPAIGDGLPDSAFAWPEERRFPIHTAEHAVLSSLYREKCAAVPGHVDAALQKAVDIYGVKDLLATTKVAEAVSEPRYLLPSIKRLAVKTAADVPVAEALLLEQYSRLNLEDRVEGFVNLAKVAAELQVPLKGETLQMAGMTMCTTKVAKELIEARRCATKDTQFQVAYEKLAAAFDGLPEVVQDRTELVKVANALAQLDEKAGVTKRYDRTIPDPIKTVFNTTKVAEEMIDLAGRQVPFSKLASMPSTFWKDLAGDDMVKEISTKTGEVDPAKLREVLGTLPLDLKIVLSHQVH